MGERNTAENNNKTIERAGLEPHNQSVWLNEQILKTVTTDR
jgi:hypothetical protein